jgi:hypothetical protein
VTTLRDLPDDRYVLTALDDGTLAAVPHGDPLALVARRWLNGKRGSGDEAAIRAWLWVHPQYRITRRPPVPVLLPCTQLALWEGVA